MNPNAHLNVITGETGAGKSIILGAVGLLLGNRADTKVLLDEHQKCIVEGTFDTSSYKLQALFEAHDLDYEATCIIRREISPAGKSRAFINDTPTTLSVLKVLGERLMDVHSQHESLHLGENAYQMEVLDSFAAHEELILNYKEASVPPQGGRKHPQQEFLQVDTSNILFICGGAFAGLDKVIMDRSDKSGIGFGAEVKGETDRKSIGETLRTVEPEDLIRYGLIPEFVGRLPVVATLEELDADALIRILTEPKNSLTKQYTKLFEMEDVEVDFREDALRAVADKAMERKTGARGLRSILEAVLLETMYDLPSSESVSKVVIDESVIKGEADPMLIYENVDQAKAAPDD